MCSKKNMIIWWPWTWTQNHKINFFYLEPLDIHRIFPGCSIYTFCPKNPSFSQAKLLFFQAKNLKFDTKAITKYVQMKGTAKVKLKKCYFNSTLLCLEFFFVLTVGNELKTDREKKASQKETLLSYTEIINIWHILCFNIGVFYTTFSLISLRGKNTWIYSNFFLGWRSIDNNPKNRE